MKFIEKELADLLGKYHLKTGEFRPAGRLSAEERQGFAQEFLELFGKDCPGDFNVLIDEKILNSSIIPSNIFDVKTKDGKDIFKAYFEKFNELSKSLKNIAIGYEKGDIFIEERLTDGKPLIMEFNDRDCTTKEEIEQIIKSASNSEKFKELYYKYDVIGQYLNKDRYANRSLMEGLFSYNEEYKILEENFENKGEILTGWFVVENYHYSNDDEYKKKYGDFAVNELLRVGESKEILKHQNGIYTLMNLNGYNHINGEELAQNVLKEVLEAKLYDNLFGLKNDNIDLFTAHENISHLLINHFIENKESSYIFEKQIEHKDELYSTKGDNLFNIVIKNFRPRNYPQEEYFLYDKTFNNILSVIEEKEELELLFKDTSKIITAIEAKNYTAAIELVDLAAKHEKYYPLIESEAENLIGLADELSLDSIIYKITKVIELNHQNALNNVINMIQVTTVDVSTEKVEKEQIKTQNQGVDYTGTANKKGWWSSILDGINL